VTTCGPISASVRTVVFALTVGVVAADARTAAAQPRAAAVQPRATGRTPLVLFWTSPSRLDAEARPLLVAAVNSGAAAAGARVLDLSPGAASPPDTAARVARAVTAYDAMRFPEAGSELDAAAATAAETGAWGLSRDGLVDLFLYRALAKTEAGDEAGAWGDFVRAATLDPARILDPARFRPTAVKSFARAVQEVLARAPVALDVRAPAGSRIHIDGRSTGRDQVSERLLPGEHFVWVERPSAPPFARTITLAVPLDLVVPEDAARPPDDGELRRRAARLGAGAPLVVALSRQDGVAVVELRSLEQSGGVMRGAVRLGPSPAAHARDLRQAVAAALRDLPSMPGVVGLGQAPAARAEPWYQNKWVWLAAGAVGALLAASPLLLDSSDSTAIDASLSTGGLQP
jgi:hypothetical protein